MAKYTPEIVDQICELIATGDHRIVDVCKQVGIHHDTLYRWLEEKPEFSERYKAAEQQRLEVFKNMARSGLAKLLDVYEYEEEQIDYIKNPEDPQNPIIRSRKVTTKKIMPNPTAVIFALTNQDSDNFKHKHEVKHSGEIKTNVSELSTDELIKRAQAVKDISDSE